MKCLIFAIVSLVCVVKCDYYDNRAAFVNEERSSEVGASIVLLEKETKVNKKLLKVRTEEFDDAFANPGKFLPAMHFFKARELIEDSEVFKFIKNVPKGAILHGHDSALVSLNYLYNLTYTEGIYGIVVDERLQLSFLKVSDDWKLLKQLRDEDAGFDDFLISQISLVKFNPKDLTNINIVWNHFINTFVTVEGMLFYAPVFKTYLYQVLSEFYDDNVMYLEIRATLTNLYDSDGKDVDAAGAYAEVIEAFMADHDDFLGARVIYAPIRGGLNEATLDSYLDKLADLKVLYPNLIAGFDLVGQEDLGEPLQSFVAQLESLDVDVFYHAGETNWYGTSTDENLIDAVLLGTKRIGHGYALPKHPAVVDEVIRNNIGIEVSPISNQVLALVEDLRNHPACTYVASGYPMVISVDDPTFWNATGASYDWYAAFMGFAHREADLKLLKQWAINSLVLSSYPDKDAALAKWEVKWEEFIEAYSGATYNELNCVLLLVCVWRLFL